MSNLVKTHLQELKIVPVDEPIESFFIDGDEWEVYQLTDTSLLYVFFDIIEQGIGTAFCVRIECGKRKYSIDTSYHSLSFTNDLSGEWEDCRQKLKDRLLVDAIEKLNVYGS